MKKVLLKAPILTQSGYGEHSRFIYRALKSKPDLFDLYIEPLNWGQTGWLWEDSEERKHIDSCIAKFYKLLKQNEGQQSPFDVCVNVDLPISWKRVAPTMIGVTAGVECDAVSPAWLQPSKYQVDKIIVPSDFAKDGFLNSIEKYRHAFDESTRGHLDSLKEELEEKISVVHYPVKDYEKLDLGIDFETDFNFILVAQWGPRKNIVETIESFYEEFENDENVGLVVKTNLARNSVPDRFITRRRLQDLKEKFPNAKCKLYMIHGELTDDEMHSLYCHPKIKAMINFGHGEGYGLPLFEAAYCGLPVITHDFGGQKDFLYADKKNKKGVTKSRAHFVKVPHKVSPVQKSSVWDRIIEPDAEWAYINIRAAKTGMRDSFKNYGLLSSQAKHLKQEVLKNHDAKDKYKEVLELVNGGEFFDFDDIDIKDLEKVSIITSVFNGDEYIEEFLEDITRQTIFEQKCELIMINANSPGNEEEVILKYQEKFPDNIVYKKLEEDPGIYGVWNMGVELSTGQYLTNANLDDRKAIDALEKHAKSLHANPHIDLVYSDMLITDKPNETWENNTSEGKRYNFPEFSFNNLKMINMPHAAPMWRKSLHETHGMFDTKYRSAGDWDMWLRAAYNGSRFKKIDGPLGLYYFNPKGISTNPENFSWKRVEEQEVYEKYE